VRITQKKLATRGGFCIFLTSADALPTQPTKTMKKSKTITIPIRGKLIALTCTRNLYVGSEKTTWIHRYHGPLFPSVLTMKAVRNRIKYLLTIPDDVWETMFA
jgi:hypothetical protein